VVLAATEPAIPALIKPLLDGSFVEKDPKFITLMPILLVGLFLVRGLSRFVGLTAMRWVATRVVMDLRSEMFEKLLVLPTHRFDDTSAGSLLSKLTYDVNQVMMASTDALIILVRDSLAVVGLLTWIFYLNWQLSLITLLIAPFVAIIVRLVSHRLRRLSRKLQDAMGELNHIIDEAIQGNKVIKIFGGKAYEMARFQHTNNWVRRYNMKLTIASEASVPTVQLLAVIALAAVVYLAALQSAADELTVGGFVSLFGAMALMLSPIKRLTQLNEQLQRGLAAAESIFALLDEPPEPDHGVQTLERAKGRISFRNAGFHYPRNETAVLQQINLEIAPGETVALVGPSGSGKTSLMNLLPRFYDLSRGEILLDGVNIASLRLTNLRGHIAYVGQDIVLFNDTLRANIAYGASRDVTDREIMQATEHAHAADFIRELPDGLDTLIGENGMRLSGGQRQRIAIARALIKDAPILVLDEATSALDTESERRVQQALEALRDGRTAFIIAHRLSTIENADRIVVLDRGEIVEIGTHEELLAQGGLYESLYRMQGLQASDG
jgi:subfamily B ATP-binding cassette protein MsbA